MAKVKQKLNNAKSEVIEENVLRENPEGLPEATLSFEKEGVTIAKYIPEMRKIQFINGRDPGQALTFHYHSETHPLKHYTLFHGKEHELPIEVIEHLENCAEHIYGYRPGPDGHPEMYVKSLKYIFSCKALRRAA
jgi:hypothetical protein